VAGDKVVPVPAPETRLRIDRRWQIIGYAIGLALFVAAIVAVATQHGVFLGAIDSIRDAPAWLIAGAIVLPLLNWLVVSVSLWLLTRAYGHVGLGEMTALIANAWLLNYLPLRPGMAGRVTYHRLVNKIRVRDSAKVIAQATAMTGISIVVLGAMAVALDDRVGTSAWIAALLAPGVLLGVVSPLLGSRPFLQRMTLALLLRHVDMLIWIARYWVVFALIDVKLDFAGAVALGVISQIALLVPFTGNGLGIREWFIGQAAVFSVVAGLDQSGVGMAAELVHRAAELSVAVPTGLLGAWWLTRRLTRLGVSRAAQDVAGGRIAPD
jgi:uncharacterized membrane protein YbhN (UPF0104 family)